MAAPPMSGKSWGPVLHPAPEMGLHFQRVDECFGTAPGDPLRFEPAVNDSVMLRSAFRARDQSPSVISHGLLVVGLFIVESPAVNGFEIQRTATLKTQQIVNGHQCFAGSRPATALQLFVRDVNAAVGGPEIDDRDGIRCRDVVGVMSTESCIADKAIGKDLY